MTIRPLGNRVLVKVAPDKEISEGGILLPDSAKEKSSHGEIVAVGEGILVAKAKLGVGDTIMYGKYHGTDIVVNGEDHRVLDVIEVFAVVES